MAWPLLSSLPMRFPLLALVVVLSLDHLASAAGCPPAGLDAVLAPSDQETGVPTNAAIWLHGYGGAIQPSLTRAGDELPIAVTELLTPGGGGENIFQLVPQEPLEPRTRYRLRGRPEDLEFTTGDGPDLEPPPAPAVPILNSSRIFCYVRLDVEVPNPAEDGKLLYMVKADGAVLGMGRGGSFPVFASSTDGALDVELIAFDMAGNRLGLASADNLAAPTRGEGYGCACLRPSHGGAVWSSLLALGLWARRRSGRSRAT